MAGGRFVPVPNDFLASIATDSERIPQLYYCGNGISSRVFWARLREIHRLVGVHANLAGRVLDFGAGGGVFLPTLAETFAEVVSIDLETTEASRVVERFGLRNVTLVEGDVTRAWLSQAPFDAIVAADVLEHFRDLGPPVEALRRWLAPGGRLFTSLPTENFVYTGLRRVYGIEKPVDHYHTAYEVEAHLARSGLHRIARRHVPLRLAPLFLVSVWELGELASG